jgi:hypothetical protein
MTQSEEVFDEDTLRAEIERVWGAHGAHAQVFAALRAQFAELGDKTERQYFDGVEVGMAIATPSAYDYDAMRARVAFLERAGHEAANEARIAHSRINDALAWYGTFKNDLHPAAAADLYHILTGGRDGN